MTKVRAHLRRLRDWGLRPLRMRLPDSGTAAYTDASHQQSLAVAQSEHAEADQVFVDSISEPLGDDA